MVSAAASANTPASVTPFVDGVPVESRGDATVAVTNPSNGTLCLYIPAGAPADVDVAVGSARRAFKEGRWSDAPPSFRKQVLYRLAELIATEGHELDALDAGEMGKPVSESTFNAAAASTLMRFYAEATNKITGDVYASDRHSLVAQRRVPRGVVAAIVPWNFPTFNITLKIAPALAAGNCLVLKPSELASRSAMRLARLAVDAGLPPGGLNVVPGLGETVGQALALHTDVDMVTFTGSSDVGKKMLVYAGHSNMKVVAAECGGKSPHILFNDGVDLDVACEWIARSLLVNQGQICSVGSRLLVQKSIEGAVLDRIVSCTKQIIMGDALDPTTTFGPLASVTQRERVTQFVENAQREGAELITGGSRALRETGGYFFEPTVLRGVSPTSHIAQEEVFGPVLSVMTFEGESEAIEIANGTRYGLMAYVWTGSLSRALRMAKAIRSSVLVNAGAPVGEGAGPALSSEPVAQSGLGVEGGLAGMETYLRRQLMWFNHT